MHIVHKITLKTGVTASDFENWVVNTDYQACHDLPSVKSFRVYRADGAFDCDYIESIEISSEEAFENDMKTPVFKSLEEAFYKMADVSGELGLTLLGDGYHDHNES